MAKKVPVTSVTPASKVKATSKAQQARTRNLVMGIATATPAGKAVKTAATAVKTAKAAKTAKTNVKTEKLAMVGQTIKIKSGGDVKSAASAKRKLTSYNQLKDMPNLIKIDSAKGNSVKKTAYRPNRRTSK